jgi:hypothetical protein
MPTFAAGVDDGQVLGYVVITFLALVVGAAVLVWLRGGISGKR